MDTTKTKKVFLYSLMGVSLVAALLAIFAIGSRMLGGGSYYISGVPYIGVYNNKGDNSKFFGDISASTASIIKYWKPDITREEEQKFFQGINSELSSKENDFVVLSVVKKYFDEKLKGELEARLEEIDTNDLGRYVNSDSKTPLFMFLAVDDEQPIEVSYHPAFVLTGFDSKQKKVRMHSYWLGSDFEVGFDEFERMWERMQPGERHDYLVVQPVGMKEKVAGSVGTSENFPRTGLMDRCVNMFKNYSIGRGAVESGRLDLAEEYFGKIQKDPNYERDFPKFFKVRLLTQMSQVALYEGDNEKALDLAKRAVEMNSGLDEASGEWAGYEFPLNSPDHKGVSMEAFLVLADVYYAMGDFQKAGENYSQVLEVYFPPSSNNRNIKEAYIQTPGIYPPIKRATSRLAEIFEKTNP